MAPAHSIKAVDLLQKLFEDRKTAIALHKKVFGLLQKENNLLKKVSRHLFMTARVMKKAPEDLQK
jgi:hypothetical protein